MELDKMYSGIPFSPFASLSRDIGAGDTVIYIDDTSVLPEAPNYATIGTDEQAETVLYSVKTDDQISGCIRGVEGTAKEWQAGEVIARNFTNKDFEVFISNIKKLNENKWEKPEAAVEGNFVIFDGEGKPKDSEENIDSFFRSENGSKLTEDLKIHIQDNEKHITDEERTNWNDAYNDRHTHSNKSTLDKITEEKYNEFENKDEANKIVQITLSVEGWQQESEGIYKQIISNDNVKDNMKINLSFTSGEMIKTLSDAGISGMIAENNAGELNIFAYGEKPAIEFPVQIELVNIKEVV